MAEKHENKEAILEFKTQDRSIVQNLTSVLPENFPQYHFLAMPEDVLEYVVLWNLSRMTRTEQKNAARSTLTGGNEAGNARYRMIGEKIQNIEPFSLRQEFERFTHEITKIPEEAQEIILRKTLKILEQSVLAKNYTPPNTEHFQVQKQRFSQSLRDKLVSEYQKYPESKENLEFAEKATKFLSIVLDRNPNSKDLHKPLKAEDIEKRRDRISAAMRGLMEVVNPLPGHYLDKINQISPRLAAILKDVSKGGKPPLPKNKFKKFQGASALLMGEGTLYLSQEALRDPENEVRRHHFLHTYENNRHMQTALQRESLIIPAAHRLGFEDNQQYDTTERMLADDLLGDNNPYPEIEAQKIYLKLNLQTESTSFCNEQGEATEPPKPEPGKPLFVLPWQEQLEIDPKTNRVVLADSENDLARLHTVNARQAVRAAAISLAGGTSVLRYEESQGNRSENFTFTPKHDVKPNLQHKNGALDGLDLSAIYLASILNQEIRVCSSIAKLAQQAGVSWNQEKVSANNAWMAAQEPSFSKVQYHNDRIQIRTETQNRNKLKSVLGEIQEKIPANQPGPESIFIVGLDVPLKSWAEDKEYAKLQKFFQWMEEFRKVTREKHSYDPNTKVVFLVQPGENPQQDLKQSCQEFLPHKQTASYFLKRFNFVTTHDHNEPDFQIVQVPETNDPKFEDRRIAVQEAQEKEIPVLYWQQGFSQAIGDNKAIFAGTEEQRYQLERRLNYLQKENIKNINRNPEDKENLDLASMNRSSSSKSIRNSQTVNKENIAFLPNAKHLPIYHPNRESPVIGNESGNPDQVSEQIAEITRKLIDSKTSGKNTLVTPFSPVTQAELQSNQGAKILYIEDINEPSIRVLNPRKNRKPQQSQRSQANDRQSR